MAYTLPQVLARIKRALLVKRVEGEDGRFRVRASAQGVDANHCIFLGAEAANAGLVDRKRDRLDPIAYKDTGYGGAGGGGERISTLAAGGRVTVVGEHGVNQASRGRTGHASDAERTAQRNQVRRIPDSRISGLVSHFASGHGTNGSDR